MPPSRLVLELAAVARSSCNCKEKETKLKFKFICKMKSLLFLKRLKIPHNPNMFLGRWIVRVLKGKIFV